MQARPDDKLGGQKELTIQEPVYGQVALPGRREGSSAAHVREGRAGALATSRGGFVKGLVEGWVPATKALGGATRRENSEVQGEVVVRCRSAVDEATLCGKERRPRC